MSKEHFVNLMWEYGLFGYDIKYNINNFIGDIIQLNRAIESLPGAIENRGDLFNELKVDIIEKFFDELTDRLYEGICEED